MGCKLNMSVSDDSTNDHVVDDDFDDNVEEENDDIPVRYLFLYIPSLIDLANGYARELLIGLAALHKKANQKFVRSIVDAKASLSLHLLSN
jgi:hypothetical protein